MINNNAQKCPPPRKVGLAGVLRAFTLAEVLITLGIIGVVSALTIPQLIANHQKKVTITKLKKAYSALSQVMQQSFADNGPTSDYILSGEVIDGEKTRNYFYTYWLPYFKGAIVADDNESFYKNRQSNQYKHLNNSIADVNVKTVYSAGRILFKTTDGMIIMIFLKTQTYIYDEDGNIISSPYVYTSNVRFYVDINGTRNPNMFGKDVFVFSVDTNTNKITAYGSNLSERDINSDCNNNQSGYLCAAKIMRDGWQISKDYPW